MTQVNTSCRAETTPICSGEAGAPPLLPVLPEQGMPWMGTRCAVKFPVTIFTGAASCLLDCNAMRIFKPFIGTALLAAGLAVCSPGVLAQNQNQGGNRPNRGNFDPEQFRQRMMDRYREQLDVKDDAEWKLISDRISKVLEARRELGFGGPGGFRMPRREGPDGGGRRGGFFGAPSPEAEALQKAIDSKASADEIKAKLAKYRESQKEKRAKLEKAQDDLRKVLSVRQEAAAVMAGLLE